jgi:hypothetical protein
MKRWDGVLPGQCLLTLIAILIATIPCAGAGFAGGTGQPTDPYQIASAEQLISIGSDPNLLNKHFVLMADIDLDPNLPGGRVFTEAVIAAPKGDPQNPERLFFIGTFDGKDHTIKNLTVHASGGEWQGLFGEIGQGGRVSNLTLDGIRISGGRRAGALAGWNTGAVDHCTAAGVISGTWMIGGLLGQNGGSLSHSQSTVRLQGGDRTFDLGGLVGMQMEGSITDCHATGEVSAGTKSNSIGGLVGNFYALEGTIANCWSAANVSSGQESDSVGGLVGFVMMGGTIQQCYASGQILCGDRSRNTGGLIGSFSGYAVTDCYATSSVTGGADTWSLGELVGSASPMRGTITNCYAIGKLHVEEGGWGLGGLIGQTPMPEFIAVTNCFWDVEATGVSTSAAGQGLTTAQMQSAQTYQDAGWDFAGNRADGTADIWQLPSSSGYPQLTVFSAPSLPRVLAGTGTPQDPYQIQTVEDLSAIQQRTAACYRLTADLDLSGITWHKACIPEFGGNFDGKGHHITHLTIRSTGPGDVGFFGYLTGRIWNLALEDVSVTAADGSRGVGGLAGSGSGYMAGCYVTGSITPGNKCLFVGGLVGDARFAIIADCYARASIRAGDECWLVGGLVGYDYENMITHCYAADVVSAGKGSEDVGGLAAGSDNIARCFWHTETNESPESTGGTGLTTSQMQDARTFLDAGWDFVGETRNGPADTWQIPENGGYPVLSIFSEDHRLYELTGAGTSSDPYQIETAKDLAMVCRYNPSACYRLMADLDLSGIVWTAAPILDFNGVFDGAGHTIANLTVRGANFSALIGSLGDRAAVKDLVIRDANVTGDDQACYVGILAGSSNGSISGCHIMGHVSAGRENRAIGGVVGEIDSGVITECRATCSISLGPKSYQVGGTAGFSLSGEIMRCCASVQVSGAEENDSVGGLVGEAHFWSVISDCYATGNISSGKKASGLGGLVGRVTEGDVFPTSGKITNCYAASVITVGEDSTKVGGLLGQEAEWQPLTSDCYFLSASDGGGPDNGNGTALFDAQMKRQASFVGWDFDSVWTIAEGKDFPRLRWEEARHTN